VVTVNDQNGAPVYSCSYSISSGDSDFFHENLLFFAEVQLQTLHSISAPMCWSLLL